MLPFILVLKYWWKKSSQMMCFKSSLSSIIKLLIAVALVTLIRQRESEHIILLIYSVFEDIIPHSWKLMPFYKVSFQVWEWWISSESESVFPYWRGAYLLGNESMLSPLRKVFSYSDLVLTVLFSSTAFFYFLFLEKLLQ